MTILSSIGFWYLPNDSAHLPGPLRELATARYHNAAPVRCSTWFGGGLGYYS